LLRGGPARSVGGAEPGAERPVKRKIVGSDAAGGVEEERVVAVEASLEDEVYGATLRPRSFEDYVGQEQVVDNLRIAIDAAARRGENHP